MIRMAERDNKKYIKPSNKEIEKIIPFMDMFVSVISLHVWMQMNV